MTRAAVALAAAASLTLVSGASTQGGPRATLDDLAFMAGCWRGDLGNGAALEEFYSSPSANLIVGTSRYLRGDRAVQFEFSRITADSSGITLLPFPGGRPSEHAFRLTAIDAGSALFEAPEHDFPRRIRYALEGDGSLTARIDGGADDARAQEWRMRPVACRDSGPGQPTGQAADRAGSRGADLMGNPPAARPVQRAR